MMKWLGIGGAASLAGCLDGSGDTPTATTEPGTTEPGSTPTDTPEPDRQVSGNYRTAVSADAQSLNWLTIADTTSGSYIGRALDGAWAVKPGPEVFPLWADVSTDDAQTYHIELRDGLEWGADYGQMTADDWVYMITNVFQAEENWSGYPSADDWFGVNPETGKSEPIGVEKTGKLTFDIQLHAKDPSWPLRPVMWGQEAMPKGLLEQYVPDKDVEGLKQDEEIQELAYAGNLGPYTFESWERESQFVVTRNENYYMQDAEGVGDKWTGAPYFEKSTIKVIKEQSARLGALERDEIDAAGIPPDKASTYEGKEGIKLNVTPQPFVEPLVYNMRANGWKPFRNKEVRQAFAMAINKPAMAEGIFRGFANPAQTMQPPWSKWYSADKITEYGIEGGDYYGKVPALDQMDRGLSGTEYGYDADGKLLDGNGEQVTLTIWHSSGQETEKTMAEFVAQEVQQNLGIKVEINATSNFIAKFAHNTPDEGVTPEWSGGYFNGGPRDVSTSAEAWDMSVNLGFNTYPRTPGSSAVFFGEKGPINYYGFVPENDITGKYEEAGQTADEEERKELLSTAFGWINEEQPFGFLVMPSDITGYREKVQGPTEEFASGWDFPTWYFDQ